LNESKDGFDVIALAIDYHPNIQCYMMTGMQKSEIIDQLSTLNTTYISMPPTTAEIQEMVNSNPTME